jgi:hypothetical protein
VAVAGSVAAPAVVTPPTVPSSTGGNTALKTILIVVSAIIVLGILCVGAVIVVGVHFARNSHVKQEGDKVKVETPFGTFSANDPDQAVSELGVEVYPGAEVQKNGAASVTLAGMHTVAANFESSDSADQVCNFYKSKFPNSTVTSSGKSRCTIASSDRGNTLTINVEASGDGAKFQIANVSRKPSSSEPSE